MQGFARVSSGRFTCAISPIITSAVLSAASC
jgi:hypothetical protein